MYQNLFDREGFSVNTLYAGLKISADDIFKYFSYFS